MRQITRNQYRRRIRGIPQTLGNWLVIKRIEADLSQAEIAEKMRIPERRLQAWEKDKKMPTKTEWEALSLILPFHGGIPNPALPALESCAGI